MVLHEVSELSDFSAAAAAAWRIWMRSFLLLHTHRQYTRDPAAQTNGLRRTCIYKCVHIHTQRKGLGFDTNANAQSSTSTHKGINMMKYVAE